VILAYLSKKFYSKAKLKLTQAYNINKFDLHELTILFGGCLIHKIHSTFIILVPVCRQSVASWH